MFRILKLISLLFFFQFNFVNGGNFNVKSVLGKWELTSNKETKKLVIEIKQIKDSIFVFSEDSYGNFNKNFSFLNKPSQLGPKKVSFREDKIELWDEDTMEVIQSYDFFEYIGKSCKMTIVNIKNPRTFTTENSYKLSSTVGTYDMKRIK